MLEFRSLQLNDGGASCLDLVEGFFDPSQVRGQDWVAYGRPGQTPGNRSHDHRPILLEGYTQGVGATPEERLESFHEVTSAIMAVMDMAAAPGTLLVAAPYLGLPEGSEATIQARCVSVGSKRMESYSTNPFQLWSIELLSVDPEWVIDESS